MQAQPGNRSKPSMEVLRWVSYAEPPLYSDELCHALTYPCVPPVPLYPTFSLYIQLSNLPFVLHSLNSSYSISVQDLSCLYLYSLITKTSAILDYARYGLKPHINIDIY